MRYEQTQPLTIAVFGSTGTQGGVVARHLLRAGFGIRALVRDPKSEQAQALAAIGAEVVAANLTDRSSLEVAMQGVYGVYLALPFFQEGMEREIAMGHNVVDAARATGVHHLIYSSGSRSNERTGVPHLDSKGEVERHLRISGVPYTVLRPVAFNYSLEAYRDSVLQGTLPDPRTSDSIVYQVDENDHATFVSLALLNPQEWLWQGFDTASDALSIRDMAATFSRVIGREVTHVQISWDEEEAIAGAEVVRLVRWVAAEGPCINMDVRRQKYPWLTPLEYYLRKHGWENAAINP